ncbi:uncharacterized protein LOC134789547 [Cydia splendana]|uniref:uncharacterized protein LOC134789547 n=1 Tax=Cydia splendana TaxID=1100963 RepID=UPI002128FD80
MKVLALVLTLWTVDAYPYYPYYGNVDTVSFGASDSSRGGMAMSKYYNPYYTQQAGGGLAAFMFRQPEKQQTSQYYLPDRQRQTQPELTYLPPQQNEVFYPQQPEKPATEQTEIADPTERTEFSTTAKTIPEIAEPEVEEVEEQKPRKRVQKRKQVKRPVEDDDDDDDKYDMPRMPAAAFFPMFFGYGGRSGSGGMPGGATAVANAYSTGRGGVASSHATAYGAPRPDNQKL